jgi:transposase-like protein
MLTGPSLAGIGLMNTHNLPLCPSLPPHCTNPNCNYHKPQSQPWPVVRFGFFRRRKPPYVVQRYRCQACGRTLSDQSFCTTYWLKCPTLLPQIHKHAVSGAANRQIARVLGTSASTVDNHLARLGRHCLLFHRQMMARASPPVDIAIDGLVTFENSQDLPYEIITAVDRESSFIFHFAEAERRRSGTMTAVQTKRRAVIEKVHGRADPKSLMRALVEVLSVTLKGAIRAQIWSDKHKTYPFAIAKIRFCEIVHKRIDSRAPRTASNPLFEVNTLDMLVRHCLKDHTRETIGFGKRRQHSMYRLAIFLVWRNYIKFRREKRCRQTPAMLIKVADHPLTEEDVLSQRLFVWHFELPPLWTDYYWRRVQTRVLPVNRRHELKYAA